MFGQSLEPEDITVTGLANCSKILEIINECLLCPVTAKPPTANIQEIVRKNLRAIGCNPGLINPLSLKEIRRGLQNFHPLFAWRIDIKLDDFISIDTHLKSFLKNRGRHPRATTLEKTRQLLEQSRIAAYYENWIEYQGHFITVRNESGHIQHLNWGLRLGDAFVYTLELYLAVLGENSIAEAKAIKNILNLMTIGNIPLGTLDSPGCRHTLLIVE